MKSRFTLKDVLEVIGGVAIIASLIFVGLETRNSALQAELNTRALEISAYQDLIDNISDINALTVENEEVAALLYKALVSNDELTELEDFRLSRAIFMRLRHGDMAYFQYERGAINESRLRSVLAPLIMGHPRMQTFWQENEHSFADGYRDYLNKFIAEINAGS